MKAALIVGINYYEYGSPLFGCVNDAYSVKTILARHDGGSFNFECKLLTATGVSDSIKRTVLKDAIAELFSTKCEIALFYFAGHGHLESTGGYIMTSDAKRGDDGVSLNEIMTMVNKSPASNNIIILDSCHSGIAGTSSVSGDLSTLKEGVTILTASDKDQYATEENGRGVFTTLLVDALSGSAADLVGNITPGSIYAHVDQSLGILGQRPVFKTNVRKFVSLRQVASPISLDDLLLLPVYFPEPGFDFALDPTYEPELKGRDEGMPEPNPGHVRVFLVLQKFNRVNLLIPVGAKNMWNAAMESKSCKLTALGEHYRRLANKERI